MASENTAPETKKKLNRFRIFFYILKESHFLPILAGFIVYFFVMSVLIWVTSSTEFVNPPISNINNFGDALWFSFASIFTIGYGDVWVSGVLGRILTVFLVIYGVLIIGLFTAIFAAFFREITERKYRATAQEMSEKLSNLENLSKDELKEISEKIRHFKSGK